jgi:hypothetical protein
MFTTPQGGYWRHQGWGQPAALNGVVNYVYDSRNTANGDPANVFHIRSTDGGVTFSAPFQLNTDTTTKAQWQPNLSAASDGSLLSVWYDERNATATCVKGSTTVGCYQMFARKSTDNGVSWGPDEAFSDVITPLPAQPDPGIVAEYVGDYDYGSGLDTQHFSSWADGRVAINNASQQDAFTDQEGGGGGGNIVLEARVKTQGTKNQVQLRWSPADGGDINILRNGAVVHTTADDGNAKDNLGTRTGEFTYQVCETDTNDCSNEVVVQVP